MIAKNETSCKTKELQKKKTVEILFHKKKKQTQKTKNKKKTKKTQRVTGS